MELGIATLILTAITAVAAAGTALISWDAGQRDRKAQRRAALWSFARSIAILARTGHIPEDLEERWAEARRHGIAIPAEIEALALFGEQLRGSKGNDFSTSFEFLKRHAVEWVSQETGLPHEGLIAKPDGEEFYGDALMASTLWESAIVTVLVDTQVHFIRAASEQQARQEFLLELGSPVVADPSEADLVAAMRRRASLIRADPSLATTGAEVFFEIKLRDGALQANASAPSAEAGRPEWEEAAFKEAVERWTPRVKFLASVRARRLP